LSLVICYAGFSFLQSSLPHTVSNVLPKEQTGIGMGIYNLLFFISGAFNTAAIGRLLDLKTAGICLNPLTSSPPGWIYSNIYITLASVVIIAVLLFYMTFRGKHKG
jgi:DHA2 family metal-tetracycline-proton antiporter-like MFS transporter